MKITGQSIPDASLTAPVILFRWMDVRFEDSGYPVMSTVLRVSDIVDEGLGDSPSSLTGRAAGFLWVLVDLVDYNTK